MTHEPRSPSIFASKALTECIVIGPTVEKPLKKILQMVLSYMQMGTINEDNAMEEKGLGDKEGTNEERVDGEDDENTYDD